MAAKPPCSMFLARGFPELNDGDRHGYAQPQDDDGGTAGRQPGGDGRRACLRQNQRLRLRSRADAAARGEAERPRTSRPPWMSHHACVVASGPARPDTGRMVERILMIDDDARLAGMVSDYLGGAGFRLTIAGTARDGEALLKRESFDAVILDL